MLTRSRLHWPWSLVALQHLHRAMGIDERLQPGRGGVDARAHRAAVLLTIPQHELTQLLSGYQRVLLGARHGHCG